MGTATEEESRNEGWGLGVKHWGSYNQDYVLTLTVQEGMASWLLEAERLLSIQRDLKAEA